MPALVVMPALPLSKGWTEGTTEAVLLEPTGRQGGLIVCHAGTSGGFLNNAFVIFRSRKTGECHEEVAQDVLRKWFELSFFQT